MAGELSVSEYIYSLVSQTWPEAAGFAVNGKTLEWVKNEKDVDDDRTAFILSFIGFENKEELIYEAEDDNIVEVGDKETPEYGLHFRLTVRFGETDTELPDANGFNRIRALLETVKENRRFVDDYGQLYTLWIDVGAANEEADGSVNDVFEINITAK